MTTGPGRRRLRTLLGAVILGVLLTACQTEPPGVTWYGNRTAVTEGPALFCEVTEQLTVTCPESGFAGSIARLSLYPDDPVQVNIPAEVAHAPWVLVTSYRDGSASTRTAVINDQGKTLSYVVQPNGHPIQQIDLQVLTITVGTDGQPQFTPYQIWVLQVDPA